MLFRLFVEPNIERIPIELPFAQPVEWEFRLTRFSFDYLSHSRNAVLAKDHARKQPHAHYSGPTAGEATLGPRMTGAPSKKTGF